MSKSLSGTVFPARIWSAADGTRPIDPRMSSDEADCKNRFNLGPQAASPEKTIVFPAWIPINRTKCILQIASPERKCTRLVKKTGFPIVCPAWMRHVA